MPNDPKELRELLAKATPGPWQAKDPYLWDEIVGDIDGPDDGQYHYTEVAQGFGRADAALIVEAVNALPGLLDEIAALQQRCEAAEAERDALRRDAGRYRWLKIQSPLSDQVRILSTPWGLWDAAIDAAIAHEGTNTGNTA